MKNGLQMVVYFKGDDEMNILILQSFVKEFEHRKDELNQRFDLLKKYRKVVK